MRIAIRNNVLRNAKNLHEEGYGRVTLNDSWLATIEQLCHYATELEAKVDDEEGLKMHAVQEQNRLEMTCAENLAMATEEQALRYKAEAENTELRSYKEEVQAMAEVMLKRLSERPLP